MEIIRGTRLIQNGTEQAIIEFVVADYTIFVFQGKLSALDILIKYQKRGTRLRTPKHIHWVVDILMKMQGNTDLTRQYLRAIQNCWNTCSALTSNDYDTLSALISVGERGINFDQYSELNHYGEYNVEFLYVLMELLAVQEKTNNPEAYMFGHIISMLIGNNRDIFNIISAAGYRGRRG